MILNTPSNFQTLPLASAEVLNSQPGASEGVFDNFKVCLSQTPTRFSKHCLCGFQTPDPEGREFVNHRGSVWKTE